MLLNYEIILSELVDEENSMCSLDSLIMLYRNSSEIAKKSKGIIVEIGAYRGASTIALALGVRDAGNGKVFSIDPHQDYTGILGGKFSTVDHDIYVRNIEKYGLQEYTSHICSSSELAVEKWNAKIDLLWIDGDHSYYGVEKDINNWLLFLNDNGILIFDDHINGSDVEAAIADNVPFSRYSLHERDGPVVAFKKQEQPRKLYLCGGMQSSGSTLVSWCFLQRDDLDGVYDMENALIQQDFSRVYTNSVWIKMTIGSFRLAELKALYEAQGWIVQPLLVQRDLDKVIQSLTQKEYGIDGSTGDDPPIFLRAKRYLEDINQAKSEDWPILFYENFIDNPEEALKSICNRMNLKWQDSMLFWKKPEKDIAYSSIGSPTLRKSRANSRNIFEAISSYKNTKNNLKPSYYSSNSNASKILYKIQNTQNQDNTIISPVKYIGTRRKIHENEIYVLHQKLGRICNHIVLGSLIRIWKKFINPSIPCDR